MIIIKIANNLLSGFGFIACAARTPKGVVKKVIKITTIKAIKLTDPMVKGGLNSEGMFKNKNPITDGKAIITPKPDAVAIAR